MNSTAALYRRHHHRITRHLRRATSCIASCAALCITLAGAQVAHAQTIMIDKVLVVVNEEAITLSEYRARHKRLALQESEQLAPFYGNIEKRILDQMIDDRVLSQVARRRGVTFDAAEVQRTIAGIAQRNNLTAQQLFERLSEDGITEAEFRGEVREQQLIRRLVDIAVNARVTVSEDEVDEYLSRHSELLVDLEEQYEVSHLFVSIKNRELDAVQSEIDNLQHIRDSVVDGRSFEQSVRDFSDGQNKDGGGYLGWRKPEQLPQKFVDELRVIDVGAVTPVIQTDSGLHLLKLHARKANDQKVEQHRLRHILLLDDHDDTDQLAERLRARIAAGDDFAKIARTHSDDPASRNIGGHLGWGNVDDLSPQLRDAVRALEVNQVSAPLRSPSGYHLIEVIERRERNMGLDLASQRARRIIFQRKADELYNIWHDVLRDSAHIEYVSASPG